MRIKALLKKLAWWRKPLSMEESLLKHVQDTIEGYRRAGIRIGEDCYVHAVNMGYCEDVEIGNNCVLTGCTILAHDASPALFIPELRDGRDLMHRISKTRRTTIHDNCFIGVNATILCGVSIGPDAIVGAGAVVTRDVPPRTVVAGNPARIVSTLDDYLEKHRREIREHPEHYPGVAVPATASAPIPR